MHSCFVFTQEIGVDGLNRKEQWTEILTTTCRNLSKGRNVDGHYSTPSVLWVAAYVNCNVTLNSGPAYRPKVGEAALLGCEYSSHLPAPGFENGDLHMKLENKHEHDLTYPAAATQMGRVEMRSWGVWPVLSCCRILDHQLEDRTGSAGDFDARNTGVNVAFMWFS
ncbi:hypothetical protein CPAR01_03874 [Colletotrichum paranaense]|uniref:Uncharacterized protein n=1 Tax=Colletotrichum paranaense TaxID=1914294 RepID=A0ABQ9SUP4_9PEZI|nr:uncharacterized protein CPAR01_03874 [Colletotrichum paranaense]KAK1543241.1 hypothetical protein CPAR01_03874 [Colletotrichum paranaense]